MGRSSLSIWVMIAVAGIFAVGCIHQKKIGQQTSAYPEAQPNDGSESVSRELAQTGGGMSREALLSIIGRNEVTQLDQVPGLLTKEFLSNFTLKHGLMVDEQGREIRGPRGHLPEGDVPGLGQHSEPLAPRVFVFDPGTGFSISYNGGTRADRLTPQEGGQTLDTMSFDFNTKTFQLSKIDFPLQVAGRATPNSQNCTLCHGPQNRPIFSMYPDWPRFYGSDNDELRFGQPRLKPDDPPSDFSRANAMDLMRRDIQLREYRYFHQFKDEVVPNHPRYTPLFSPAAYNVHRFTVTNDNYQEYPYRSDVEQPGVALDASAVSRSFTRRAGLRFNLLYSRLLVQQVVQKIKTHPRFTEYAPFFVYNLMRCGVETNAGNVTKQTAVMRAWQPRVLAALKEVEEKQSIPYFHWNMDDTNEATRLVRVGYFQLPNGQLTLRERGSLLDYGQNLALFDLKINDVDMRFTYYHEAYKPENAYKNLCDNLPAGKDCGDQVMQVGYLQKSYFNSYNDGSTTMDEHLVAELLKVMAQSDVALANYLKQRGPFAIRGLLNKYAGATFEARMVYDREFFTQMDSYSKWFSLPYPMPAGYKADMKSFYNLHHRAPFSQNYLDSYNGVCGMLERKLTTP